MDAQDPQMNRRDKYPFVVATRKFCAILKISPERVLKRAGLPPDALNDERNRIPAQKIFGIGRALSAESQRDDLTLYLAREMAHGPLNAAVFAYSCSPNIATGLERLALLKPLVGPTTIDFRGTKEGVAISFISCEPASPLPTGAAIYQLVHFLESSRVFTSAQLTPLRASIPRPVGFKKALDDYLGVTAEIADKSAIVLSHEDTLLPFISENAELWSRFESSFHTQLLEHNRDEPMTARVKRALLELLPSGQTSVTSVCERLHISKRSLQRRLKNEGETFKSLLDATRSEMSLHYLEDGVHSVEEISYLLGYRDPNSFYRAFRNWTGMTPLEARIASSK